MASSFGRGFDSLQVHTKRQIVSVTICRFCVSRVTSVCFGGFGKSPENAVPNPVAAMTGISKEKRFKIIHSVADWPMEADLLYRFHPIPVAVARMYPLSHLRQQLAEGGGRAFLQGGGVLLL